MPRQYKYVLFSLFLTGLIALTAWSLVSSLQNTLVANPNWRVTKLGLEKYVNGTQEYVSMTQALFRQRLNLGIWNGFQEVVTTSPYPIGNVEFKFLVNSNSYIDFIYDKNPNTYTSIRFSVYTQFPSQIIAQKSNGEFLAIQKMSHDKVSAGIWHHARLEFSSNDQSLRVYLDNQLIANSSLQVKNYPTYLGFRGSYAPALVDSLTVTSPNGSKVFMESFSLHRPRLCLQVFIICYTISILVLLIILLRKSDSRTLLVLISFQIALIITLSTIAIILHFFLLSRFPNPNSTINQIYSKLSQKPQTNSPLSYIDERNQEIQSQVTNINNNLPRILFLGTSQTWGAGAQKNSETYVNVIAKLISINSKKKYEIINAGISGSYSDELVDYYKEHWIKFHPNIVVVDLAYNDTDSKTFHDSLTELVEINRQQRIKTVFVFEPSSIEADKQNLDLPLYDVMRQISHDQNIPIIDANSYMLSQQSSGNLWWDPVHPTSYGHLLLGTYIFNSIKSYL
jgi:lysophospholipase L1-like esterase